MTSYSWNPFPPACPLHTPAWIIQYVYYIIHDSSINLESTRKRLACEIETAWKPARFPFSCFVHKSCQVYITMPIFTAPWVVCAVARTIKKTTNAYIFARNKSDSGSKWVGIYLGSKIYSHEVLILIPRVYKVFWLTIRQRETIDGTSNNASVFGY